MKNTIIAVPSYGRAEWAATASNFTLTCVSKEYLERTYLVVREEEAEAYKVCADKYGCKMKIIPNSLTEGVEFKIRETRDFIFDSFIDECEYLLVLEDDMRIDIRKDIYGHYQRIDNPEVQFKECMRLLESADMDMPVTSVLPRLFCLTKASKKFIMNGDCCQLTMFYTPFLRKHIEMRYKYGPVYMEDFTLMLKIMTAGYGCGVFCDFIKQDVLNAKRTTIFGGCNAVGRKLKDIDEAAISVAKAFPEYVTAYEKIKPSTWGTEPTIGLKVAYAKLKECYRGATEDDLR